FVRPLELAGPHLGSPSFDVTVVGWDLPGRAERAARDEILALLVSAAGLGRPMGTAGIRNGLPTGLPLRLERLRRVLAGQNRHVHLPMGLPLRCERLIRQEPRLGLPDGPVARAVRVYRCLHEEGRGRTAAAGEEPEETRGLEPGMPLAGHDAL